MIEIATWAPNDKLREPWHFYILRGKAKEGYEELVYHYLVEHYPDNLKKVETSMNNLKKCPVVIIATSDQIPGDEGASRDNDYAVCCAIYGMWIAAQELGLGMVWRTRGIGLAREESLYTLIGSPSNRKTIGTIFLGYPESNPPATKRTPYL